MTVKELISRLSNCNPEAEVRVPVLTETMYDTTVKMEKLTEDLIEEWADFVYLGDA